MIPGTGMTGDPGIITTIIITITVTDTRPATAFTPGPVIIPTTAPVISTARGLAVQGTTASVICMASGTADRFTLAGDTMAGITATDPDCRPTRNQTDAQAVQPAG